MGNTNVTVKNSLPKWENTLSKGYSCYYYLPSSLPSAFIARKCTVLRHDRQKLYYILSDDELKIIYHDVPGIFISTTRVTYQWSDYFDIDTVVKFQDKRARIIKIHKNNKYEVLFDLVDAQSGERFHAVVPKDVHLDRKYYGIK